MDTFKSFSLDLYSVNEQNFADIALQLFHFQAEHNLVYRSYLQHLRIDTRSVSTLTGIPFLPISFFKRHQIKTGDWAAETSFLTSGTTGENSGSHPVKDLNFYLEHTIRCFQYFYGDIRQYHFLALLPSYLERRNSSLVAMLDHFMKKSHSRFSGFYLDNISGLLADLQELRREGKKPSCGV